MVLKSLSLVTSDFKTTDSHRMTQDDSATHVYMHLNKDPDILVINKLHVVVSYSALYLTGSEKIAQECLRLGIN